LAYMVHSPVPAAGAKKTSGAGRFLPGPKVAGPSRYTCGYE
jgi:hypothetical protein